jgi:hypothetical protein
MIRTVVFLFLVTVLASCNFSGDSDVITGPGETNSLSAKGEWGSYVVKYPVYGNSFADSLIRELTDSLVTGFKPMIKYALEDKMKYEMEVNYEEYFADGGIVSIVFKIYQFTGGAHGNTFIRSFVIDSKNKKRLGLADFFKGDGFKVLQKTVREKLKKKLEYDESIDEGTAQPGDFSAFAVTNDKFIFWFSPYQVASYADGVQKVEIPRK